MKTMKDICPNWNDPKQAASLRKELRDYAIQSGFTPEEISKFNKDGRIVTALMKALKFDRIANHINT